MKQQSQMMIGSALKTVGKRMLDGLAFLHAKRVIHRELMILA